MNQKGKDSPVKGKNLTQNIMLFSSYGILVMVLIIVFTGSYDLLPWFCIGIIIYLLCVVILQLSLWIYTIQSHGGDLLDSDITEDFDRYEEQLLPIEKVDELPKMSPQLNKELDKFTSDVKKAYEEISSETEVQRFKRIEKKMTEYDKEVTKIAEEIVNMENDKAIDEMFDEFLMSPLVKGDKNE